MPFRRRTMKKHLIIFYIASLVWGVPLMAQSLISANDLDPEQITSIKDHGGVKIVARSDKNVTIEVMDIPREAPDGSLFNNRIKLNGAGSVDYRSLIFTVSQKGLLTVYCNSSSKTDSRILLLGNTSDGSVITEITAEPDTGTKAGMTQVELSSGGTFALFSKSGGINIYQLAWK